MKKPERIRLYKMMLDMLTSFATIDEKESLPEIGVIHWRAQSLNYGMIQGTFYNAEDAKQSPWLACQLKDWPRETRLGSEWNGFDHWKQNFHGFYVETPEQFLDCAVQHLETLGLSPVREECK